MSLIDWDDALTEGRGRSGTRYRLSYRALAADDARSVWWIGVEGADVCALASAEEAISHSEGLEAMRCLMQGISDQLDLEELRRGRRIANEMRSAAEQALGLLPADNTGRPELQQNLEALQVLADAIAQECRRRQREAAEDLPLLH